MAEIPEHLLKRSRDRRAALAGGGDEAAAGESAPTPSATPATTAAAAPATAAPAAPAGRGKVAAPAVAPPPKPDSAVVVAYKKRRRAPFWAMMALSLLPVWAFMYARAITTQAKEAVGPLGLGSETYSNCASCHGATGGGGVGYAFTNGDAFTTFPHIEDQLRFVYYGTDAYKAAEVDVYGDPNREGGPHLTGGFNGGVMPGWGNGTLPDAEILGVVCHERYTLGEVDPEEHLEEYEKWCSEESEIFIDLEGGGDLRTVADRFDDVMPIGDVPVAGSPAGE